MIFDHLRNEIKTGEVRYMYLKIKKSRRLLSVLLWEDLPWIKEKK